MEKKYIAEFQEKKTVIIDSEDNSVKAAIDYPKLGDEFSTPVNYPITSLEGKLLGNLESQLPVRGRISLSNGSNSFLIVGGNEELVLKVNGEKYDVGRLELDDFTKGRDELKNAGFCYGYAIRSSKEKAELNFFEKNSLRRAYLQADDSDFLKFTPLLMLERIKADIQGKTPKKQEVKPREYNIKQVLNEGAFVKFVKENFPVRIIENAFEYQEQAGEKSRFLEYMNNNLRPIILNGPTGNGKTVLARDYASQKKVPFYFDTGNSSFKLSTAVGKFVPSPGNPSFSPGSLLLAAIHGGVYVLEEMAAIPQDELTGLNIFLETGEMPIITQFGHEMIKANPDFRFVATGNFHNNYTINELNDAFLQRFSQIKFGYPGKDNTVDILQARAPGLDYPTAEIITSTLFEMRDEARKASKDLGLKGIVELAQRFAAGSPISIKDLFEDCVINPLTTYENHIERKDGELYSKLNSIVGKYF